jgi:transcriptional regulator with XRE-family HTH domain
MCIHIFEGYNFILKTIGDRITYCRSAINLTRKELSELWDGASIPTLSRWELDIIIPSSKKMLSMSEFFCSKGLIVTRDWIEKGVGVPPSILNTKEFTSDEFDEICEQTLFVLSQNIKNFVYYKVTSNFFSPIIRYGDYVAGVKIDKEDIMNLSSLAFVVHDNIVHVGFLECDGDVFLKNSQGKKMEFKNYTYLVKVHWTAIRP